MRRIVWTFGLIAGTIFSLMMIVSMSFVGQIGFDNGEIIGYTTMIAAFLMVFFGIRSYRDSISDGVIGFGKAFQVGILITVVATVCYVATWEVIYYKFAPDFSEKYASHQIEKAKGSGASQQQIAAQVKEMEKFKALYKSPLVNMALTFLEPFPVGLVVTLVCAGILSRRGRRTHAPASIGPAAGAHLPG